VALTKLTRLDTVPIDGNDFTAEFNMWVTNQVDIINQDLELLDDLLASIDARLIAGGL
jgi:hypothetical protein